MSATVSSSKETPRRSLRPAGVSLGSRKHDQTPKPTDESPQGPITYTRQQLMEIRAKIANIHEQCPGSLRVWLRNNNFAARPRFNHSSSSSPDDTSQESNQRREKDTRRASSKLEPPIQAEWARNPGATTITDAKRSKDTKKERKRSNQEPPSLDHRRAHNDLWDTPNATSENFAFAALPKPSNHDKLLSRSEPLQTESYRSRHVSVETNSNSNSNSNSNKQREREREREREQREREKLPARKVDERFKHLWTAQSEVTLDDLIDNHVTQESLPRSTTTTTTTTTQAAPPAQISPPVTQFKTRSASTDSEKLPRLIDLLMEDNDLSNANNARDQSSSLEDTLGGRHDRGLEFFMMDALHSLNQNGVSPHEKPAPLQGSRLLSWIHPMEESDLAPERSASSALEDVPFDFDIERLLGEQPKPQIQAQPQAQAQAPFMNRTQISVHTLFANAAPAATTPQHSTHGGNSHVPMQTAPTFHPGPSSATQLNVQSLLPQGAVVSHQPVSAPPNPSGDVLTAVNLLERLTFVESSSSKMVTPTKEAPAQQFAFHQTQTSSNSAKKPGKKLVSNASRFVLKEQKTPSRDSTTTTTTATTPASTTTTTIATPTTPSPAPRTPISHAAGQPTIGPSGKQAQRISVHQLMALSGQKS